MRRCASKNGAIKITNDVIELQSFGGAVNRNSIFRMIFIGSYGPSSGGIYERVYTG
jgi:hypothetical protein